MPDKAFSEAAAKAAQGGNSTVTDSYDAAYGTAKKQGPVSPDKAFGTNDIPVESDPLPAKGLKSAGGGQ